MNSSERGRFTPGTLLAERYRIVGLLGRGGMGEVYRAEDLKLGQDVALKFLPAALEQDEARLTRLLGEVRLARQVSHPNVCRVYDIAEAQGAQFMAMEYVDGEDLASLLRRIGRLPREKALEIARQICAGLAAAHGQGILHRDLKPGNIMIDGRGRVKLTDFGLAALGHELTGEDAGAGTPAYMAPEQLAGREASVRSDVYALGLVLHEIFTGEAVFRGRTHEEIARLQAESSPTRSSSTTAALDDAVDRVIRRCLQREPSARPASALAVAAALPGGDPLAAALAAGETPSPEMVAEAGSVGGLRPLAAWLLLAGFLLLLAFCVAGARRHQPVTWTALPKSAAVLEERAQEILVALGYDREARDRISDFTGNGDFLQHLRKLEGRAARDSLLERGQPAVIHFGYRQSPRWLAYPSQGSVGGWVQRQANPTAGELRLGLDPQGRLVWLDVTPPDRLEAPDTQEPAWGALIAAAGFDSTRLAPAAPLWLPPRAFDRRMAWTGTYPDAPDVPVRIEAAALAGRPTSLRIIEPWTRPLETAQAGSNTRTRIAAILDPLLWLAAMATIAVLAWRNLRRGRGDRRTALRFAIGLAGARLAWYLFAHHVPTGEETGVLTAHLAWSLWRFGLAFAFYVALEPYVRRLWPHMLTAWVRLFDNRFRDPLVGRDILVGLLLAALVAGSSWLMIGLLARLGLAVRSLGFDTFSLEALRGLSGASLAFVGIVTNAGFTIFMVVTIIFILRFAVRRDLLVLIPVFLIMLGFNWGDHPLVMAQLGVFALAMWVALFRFGLLTFVTFMVARELLEKMPLTFELGAWWAAPSWITLGALLLVALWTFRASLAGQAAFGKDMLGD